MKKLLKRFTVRDLLIIAAMAALGIAIKPVVVPLAHLISSPLMIPGGAIAGGLYMMWIVVAFGLTGKHGAPTLTALVQAILVIITG
ncbi:MAG: ECF transporter S component, partial [Oscillospiraceae bacterium]|nr:ECF transporter S component [Oscillospiraceae bacterium]